jgi:DNA-binding LytR/AlgR family response regulator
VVWLQSVAHYTTVHTRDQQYFCNLSLADLEERLDLDKFLRTHRSYFINLHHAQTIERENDSYTVVMAGTPAPRVPVSRSRVQALKDALGLSRPSAGRGSGIDARTTTEFDFLENFPLSGLPRGNDD